MNEDEILIQQIDLTDLEEGDVYLGEGMWITPDDEIYFE